MGPKDAAAWSSIAPYVIPALIVLVLLRRNLRTRPLKVERMWLYPSLMAAAAAMMMAGQPPPLEALPIALIAGGLGLGGLIGWQRGRLTHIVVDPKTQELSSRSSPLGTLLILALFAVRYGLRAMPLGVDLPVSAQVLTDASLLFAIGMMSAQRAEMWIRARRRLAELRADASTP